MQILYWYVFAFMATIVFINLLHQPARYFGLLDTPCGRKNHLYEVPLTGGLAIFLAITLTASFDDSLRHTMFSILPPLLLVVATGMGDDKFDLSPKIRLLMEVVTVLYMVYLNGLPITYLGDLFGTGAIRLDAWSIPYTIFCVVGVMNAINMLDGIDGLAGGVVFVAVILFGIMAIVNGNVPQAGLLFLLASALLGFNLLNMRFPWHSKATVFLGDSGSMMLGFLLAWFCIDLSQENVNALSPITTVWILGVPILDTVSLMLRRMLSGRSPFTPGHDHLHHILLRAGFSVPQTAVLITSSSMAMGLIGIVAWTCGVKDYVMCYSFIIISLIYLFGSYHEWRPRRLETIFLKNRVDPQLNVSLGRTRPTGHGRNRP